MSEGPLGWYYPAGAANDPNAPWNQSDEHCPYCCPAHEDAELTCSECSESEEEGMCYLFEFLPDKVAIFLATNRRFKFLLGKFPSYCDIDEEPECKCCDCEASYDDSDD